MTTINRLTAVSDLNAADQLPLYSTESGDARKASMTVFAEYIRSIITGLTVSQGGTGLSSITVNGVMLGNGTNPVQTVSPGASGRVLMSDGTTWNSEPPSSVAAGTADVAYSLKSNVTTGKIEIVGPALGTTRVMTLPDANATILTNANVVTVAQGGTGKASIALNNVMLGNGASAIQEVAPSTSGNVLTSNGTSWVSQSISGLTVSQGGTGANTLTLNNVLLGNGTGALQVVAPGTSGNLLTSNGTTWQSTALTGITVGNTSMTITDSGANGTIIFTNDAVESMRITNVGEVGIGTNAPNADLHVYRATGDASFTVETADLGGSASFLMSAGTATISSGVDGNGAYWDVSSGRYEFAVGGSSVAYLGSDGSIVSLGGLRFGYMAAPTTKAAAATLTGAELAVGMLEYTGGAANIQFPTGTQIQSAISSLIGNNNYFDWCVVNTGAGTCTMTTNTDLTLKGLMTIPTNTSAEFRIRRTASNTFTIYRI